MKMEGMRVMGSRVRMEGMRVMGSRVRVGEVLDVFGHVIAFFLFLSCPSGRLDLPV